MHIHLPKVPENWREVAIEIAIITVGVLIALSLESWLEDREWHRKVATAEAAMRRKLLWDNGPQVYYRAAAHPCAMARLDAIRAAVEQDKGRSELWAAIDGFWVDFMTYDSLAHQDATASDVAAHMEPSRLDDFTLAYAVMPLMDQVSRKEAADLAQLRSIRRSGPARLSELEVVVVLGAIEALRNDERQFRHAAGWAMPAIRRLGTIDAGRTADLMRNARSHYGDCLRALPARWPAGELSE